MDGLLPSGGLAEAPFEAVEMMKRDPSLTLEAANEVVKNKGWCIQHHPENGRAPFVVKLYWGGRNMWYGFGTRALAKRKAPELAAKWKEQQ